MNFDPIFVFDSREKWHPVGVEESLALHGYVWAGTSWQQARGAKPYRDLNHLDFPADMKQPDLPPVGYHRAIKSGPLIWHQLWLFYLYNPWSVAGVGRHEGDWEFVQVGATGFMAGDEPVLVTASQHHSGGKREFWACELRDGRPVIYVALGSHANYFHAGRLGGGQDECDGKGRVLDTIEWRDFGPWKDWPGRWGNSSGQGKSPESPGCQGKRWHAPHLFHSEAR